MRYSHDEWLELALKINSDNFSFEKSSYIDSYTKVKVYCKKHKCEIEIDPLLLIKTKIDCNCKKKKASKFKCIDGYTDPVLLKVNQVQQIRNEIINIQNNICPLCENEIQSPTLDHYHSKKQHGSGLVRGVICSTCNRMTGVIENNFVRNCIPYSYGPDFLRKLADYLEKHRYPFLYPTEKPKPKKLSKNSYNKLCKEIKKSNKKIKIPKFNSKLTKELEKLFEKYKVQPEFNK